MKEPLPSIGRDKGHTAKMEVARLNAAAERLNKEMQEVLSIQSASKAPEKTKGSDT